MKIIASVPYLNTLPKISTILFNQITLLAVSLPILMELSSKAWGVVAAFVLLVFGRVALLFFGIQKLAIWQLIVLLVVVGALVFGKMGTFFGLQGGMAFLLLLAGLKSFEGHSRRDWQISAIVQIFLLTVAVLLNQSLITGIWVLVCLMLIATSLAMLNDVQLNQAWRQSLVGFSLTLLPMLILFITMPRKEAPFWGMPQSNEGKSASTGLSDTMKPGSIGDLVQSNEPAFTATFDNDFYPQQNQLYWRAIIMGERDEKGEWRSLKGFIDNAQPKATKNWVEYQIVTEDKQGVIPALDYPLDDAKRGVMRELGNVARVFSRQGMRGIHLTSSLSDELPHNMTPREVSFYTYTGKQKNVRAEQLSKSLFGQSGGNTEKFAHLTYQYFNKQGFTYTLKPPVLNEETNIDEFLFQSKQGFCEHYADAFVMLMRMSGVPARVVTGYQGGEWNEQGKFWQIRSKDAHAWAEIWLPERHVWKRIDPTAAVSQTRVESGLDNALPESEIKELVSNLGKWEQFFAQSQVYWQRWVVNFDNAQQRSLFSLLGFASVNAGSIAAILLLGLLPALIPIVLWWRRSRRQDILPMDDGFLLLKRNVLGSDFPNLNALGAVELKNELRETERLTPDLESVINDYIRLNYAQKNAPQKRVAQKWYIQAKKIARKHHI